jgi:hypothetical protein
VRWQSSVRFHGEKHQHLLGTWMIPFNNDPNPEAREFRLHAHFIGRIVKRISVIFCFHKTTQNIIAKYIVEDKNR